MKKLLMILMLTILMVSLAFAVGNNSASLNNTNDDENDSEDDDLLGASCGTVTPGTQNECCINKGYSGWNQKEFKCTEEDDDEDDLNETEVEEEDECDAWKCTKWSACLNGTEKRTCSRVYNCSDDEETPKTIKSCSEKERIKNRYSNSSECPESCTCSGSTVKCILDNGARVMTIYAGKSGNVIVQIKDLNMSTNVTLYKGENGKVYGTFKGNNTREIVLPDEAKERLQNHTKTRLYNESINLTEDGYYLMDMKKKSRLFWLVPVREHMEAEVDAETGEAVKIRNPWWGFLAKDIRNNSSEED